MKFHTLKVSNHYEYCPKYTDKVRNALIKTTTVMYRGYHISISMNSDNSVLEFKPPIRDLQALSFSEGSLILLDSLLSDNINSLLVKNSLLGQLVNIWPVSLFFSSEL